MNPLLEILLRIMVCIAGIYIVLFTLNSAIRSFVLPRGDNVKLTRIIFQASRKVFDLKNRKVKTYEERDRNLAMYAPVTLLIVPIVWVMLVIFGYSLIYWAVGISPYKDALQMSGSSLLTLGTVPFKDLPITLLEFSEAAIGLGLVALLISYLPTMYAAFSKRESLVTMLEVRAGSPPSAAEMIKRMQRIRGLDQQLLHETWMQWEVWFTDLEESHTSLAPMVFFRSPSPNRSWLTAAGTILDTAAIITSTVDIPRNPQAQLTIRAGFLALRSIADFFKIPHEAEPKPDDPISITREEFDEVYDDLHAAGVPLIADRDQAWRDFSGWRVNYDTVLLSLSRLIQPPYAAWVSDRSIPLIIQKRLLQRTRTRQPHLIKEVSSNGR